MLLPAQGHSAALTDLEATDSSEALLLGRKPPFRLHARVILQASPAAAAAGPAPSVMDAVSEGFVVATRRTRTTSKVDIPSGKQKQCMSGVACPEADTQPLVMHMGSSNWQVELRTMLLHDTHVHHSL